MIVGGIEGNMQSNAIMLASMRQFKKQGGFHEAMKRHKRLNKDVDSSVNGKQGTRCGGFGSESVDREARSRKGDHVNLEKGRWDSRENPGGIPKEMTKATK